MYNHRTCVSTQTTSLFLSLNRVLSNIHVAAALLFFALLFFGTSIKAQQAGADTAYERVISERVLKIVNGLGIENGSVHKNVNEVIKNQYFSLNRIHDDYKSQVSALKLKNDSKENITAERAKLDAKKSSCLRQLHNNFIGLLNEQLSPEQVEKVKDGMTYRILPVTWTAYMDMLLHLTEEQKKQMHAWLVEARELAMDEGSSDQKHAVFGKYKGKINNYLSAAGYDMKKEGEEWWKRIEDKKKTNHN